MKPSSSGKQEQNCHPNASNTSPSCGNINCNSISIQPSQAGMLLLEYDTWIELVCHAAKHTLPKLLCKDVISVSRCCKLLHSVTFDESIWQSMFKYYYAHVCLPEPVQSWMRTIKRPFYEIFKKCCNSVPFVWGFTTKSRLGIPSDQTRITQPTLLYSLAGKHVAYFAKAQERGSCAVTASDIWGRNALQSLPKLCPFHSKVVHARCGYDECVFVLEDGDVVIKRKHNNFESVGLALEDGHHPCVSGQNSSSGVLIRESSIVIAWDSQCNLARILPPANVRIAKITSSHRYWFAISDIGEAFICHPRVPTFWTRIPGTEGLTITDIDGGTEHFGLLTTDGHLFTCGDNTFHQLGYFSKNVVQKPMRVEWFVKNNIVVQAFACGGNEEWDGGFTLVLSSHGNMYMCGGIGEVGLSHPQLVLYPELHGRVILSFIGGEDWIGLVASDSAPCYPSSDIDTAPETQYELEENRVDVTSSSLEDLHSSEDSSEEEFDADFGSLTGLLDSLYLGPFEAGNGAPENRSEDEEDVDAVDDEEDDTDT